MTRFRLIRQSVVASYGLLGTNILYSLVSVPLLLLYLTKQEFGLWAAASQILAFFAFLDLGTNSSLARLLIDHKDKPDRSTYGSFVKAGIVISIAQAVFTLAVGLLLIKPISRWLKLSPEVEASFSSLMLALLLVSCIGLSARVFGQLLHAWQRLDIQYYIATCQLLFSLVGLWVGLKLGFGIYATAFGAVWGTAFGIPAGFLACTKLGLWPGKGNWGTLSKEILHETFGYGLNLFVIATSTQIIIASQTILLSRQLGLEAAATWAVMTKMYSLASQSLWKLVAATMPAFAEMQVRGEDSTLRASLRLMSVSVYVLAGVLAVVFSMTNNLFVRVWTNSDVTWSPVNNVFLGVWLCLLTQQCVTNSMLICTKRVTRLKYIYIAEAALFLVVAPFMINSFGISGMLVASIITTGALTWMYGIIAARKTMGVHSSTILFEWQKPAVLVVASMLAVSAPVAWLTTNLASEPRLVVLWGVLAFSAVVSSFCFALPRDLSEALRERAPSAVRRWIPGSL